MNDARMTTKQLRQRINELELKIAALENPDNFKNLKKGQYSENAAVENSDEKYRSIFEGAYDGIVHVDKNLIILNVNPSFTKITGIAAEDAIGISGFDLAKKFVNLKLLPSVLKAIKTVLTKKPNQPYQLNFKNKILEISTKKQENGHMVGIIRDITLQKQAEEELRDSEERFKLIYEHAPYGIFLGGLDGTVIDGNKAAEKILGYTTEEVAGANIFNLKFTDVSNFPKILKALAKSALGKKTGPEIYIANRRDNTQVYIEISTYPVKIKNKSVILGIGHDITKRIKAEASLRESEEKYRLLFERSADATLLIKGSTFVDCNDATLRMLGCLSKDEFINLHPSQISPELQADNRRSIEKADEMMAIAYEKGSHRFEWLHLRMNGEVFPVEVLLTAIPIGNEKILHVVWRDITTRKKAEEVIQKSELHYRALFENSPVPLWEEDFSEAKRKIDILKRKGVKDFRKYFEENPEIIKDFVRMIKIIEVNKPALELHEAKTKDELLQGLTAIFKESSLNNFKEELIAIAKKRTNFEFDGEVKTINGKEKYIHLKWTVVPGYEETMEKVYVSTIDISDRIIAEKTLRDSESLLRESQKVAHLGSYTLDIKSGFWKSSEILLEIFGIDKNYVSDFEGWANIVHPNEREMMKHYLTSNILTNHELFNKEYRIIRQHDKKVRWVHGIGRLEFDSSGKPEKMIGTIQDITERKLIDVALSESEAKYRSLIEHSNDAIYLLYNRKFEIVNNQLIQMFGYTPEEINKADFDFIQFVAPKSRSFVEDRQKQIAEGKNLSNKYEFTAITKNGNEIEVEASVSFIEYKDGRATQGIIRDITERKKRQEILMDAMLKVQEDEKNKFGKELHDGLGQVLISTSLYIESLRKLMDELPEKKKKDLEMARQLNKQAITDARRISHGLMVTGLDEYGLRHMIKQMCKNTSTPELLFVFEHVNLDEEKINYESKIHLYRIAQELSTNILKHSDATKAKIYLSISQSNILKLVVSDNGKSFDPKQVKHGAGLNNVIHRNTILNGKIDISSTIGKGTKISITIPL